MGLTPSEKKRYNESKKRRRQAIESYQTGRIKPIRSKGKIIAFAAAVLVIISVSAVVSVYIFSHGKQPQTVVEEKQDNSALLRIVSNRYPLDKSFVPNLENFAGYKVNSVMINNLGKLFFNAEEKGIELKINSAYIDYESQSRLYEEKLRQVKKEGKYSEVRAAAVASSQVAKPGESEAQLGMLVDFDVSDPKAKAFLEREGINYGFILRFQKEKEDITHRNYSASVYRYVGSENAGKMRTLNMCLEEFADYMADN